MELMGNKYFHQKSYFAICTIWHNIIAVVSTLEYDHLQGPSITMTFIPTVTGCDTFFNENFHLEINIVVQIPFGGTYY